MSTDSNNIFKFKKKFLLSDPSSMSSLDKEPRVDIDKPKFDTSTYFGRAKHFFFITNPLNILATNKRLERAHEVVTAYRARKAVPYVKTTDELWREKYLYDSAFHPETGEKMFILGRMSAQMPVNTFITGCMVIFYKSSSKIFFFQWLNQTFNAVVNYTNRSGKSEITYSQVLQAYFMATFGALATAASLKHYTRNLPDVFARLVPFVAVAAANCVNLPLMRQSELRNGISLVDKQDREVGVSRKAAVIAISSVVFSRVMMAVPCMIFAPLVVNRLERKGVFLKYPNISAPVQAALVGFSLIFSTPLGCAFFRQKSSIKVSNLESQERESIQRKYPNLDEVYYNKGL